MRGEPLVAGAAAGAALVLGEPLSFWGGLDPATGHVIDRRHPQHGESLTGRVVVMPAGRGSSSSTTVLAEAIRLNTAPAAILLSFADVIIIVGAMVAAELYGRVVPVIRLMDTDLATIVTGMHIIVGDDGLITVGARG